MNQLKAVLAAILAGLSVVLGDLRGADSTLTVQDWLTVAVAALVVGIGTYLIPPGVISVTDGNARHLHALRTPKAPTRRRGQRGSVLSVLLYAFLVLLVIVGIIKLLSILLT